MATLSTDKFITLSNLQSYNTLIQKYVTDEAGTAAAAGLKTVKFEGNIVKFYKEAASDIQASTAPAYTVDLSGIYSDVTTLKGSSTTEGSVDYKVLQAIGALGKDAQGADYANVKAYVDDKVAKDVKTVSDKVGDLTKLTTTQTDLVAAINEVDADITTLNGADTVAGSVAKAVKDAKDTVEGEIGTLTSLKTTAKTDLVSAINEVADEIDDLSTDSEVYVDTAETATEGYLKTYVISQGKDAQGKKIEIGKIDIPKDLVTTSGSVVKDPEGQPAGTYIKLTIANQTDPIYINVADLAHDYTAQASATQVQVAISDAREISATIVAGSVDAAALGADAVETAKIKDAQVTAAKLAANSIVATVTSGTVASTTMDDTVVGLLQKANDAVQEADIVTATTKEIQDLFAKEGE